MAIRLKYGAPGPVLLAGYAGGVGSRQKRDQQNALELWQQQTQRGFQAQQADIGRRFQAWQQQQGFNQQANLLGQQQDFQAAQGALNRDFRLNEAAFDRNQRDTLQKGVLDARSREAALGREHQTLLAKQREDLIRDKYTMDGLRTGELALPPEAQSRLQKLESARIEAMKLDPDQQTEFMERYEAEKRALNRMAQPAPELSYDERVKKGLGANYDQYKDLPWQFSQQGEMSLPSGFKIPQEEDPQADYDQKYNESVMKRYEKNLSETDPEDPEKKLYADEDEALQAAIDAQNAIERGRQRLSGKQSSTDTKPSSPIASVEYQSFKPTQIKASNGKTYQFTSQKQLDDFRRLTGMTQ
jgi:hypothetical protein